MLTNSEDVGTIDGPDLNVGHFKQSCVVNQFTQQPYLYVLGGETNVIERINLNHVYNDLGIIL